MKTLAERMREDDPLSCDPGLTDSEASAIRRRAVAEAVDVPARRIIVWRDALAIVVVVAVMIGVGITGARRLPPPSASSDATASEPRRASARRQLQFATPGGTRIIWTFDSDFSVKETIP
jgi:hypothetical protein